VTTKFKLRKDSAPYLTGNTFYPYYRHQSVNSLWVYIDICRENLTTRKVESF